MLIKTPSKGLGTVPTFDWNANRSRIAPENFTKMDTRNKPMNVPERSLDIWVRARKNNPSPKKLKKRVPAIRILLSAGAPFHKSTLIKPSKREAIVTRPHIERKDLVVIVVVPG